MYFTLYLKALSVSFLLELFTVYLPHFLLFYHFYLLSRSSLNFFHHLYLPSASSLSFFDFSSFFFPFPLPNQSPSLILPLYLLLLLLSLLLLPLSNSPFQLLILFFPLYYIICTVFRYHLVLSFLYSLYSLFSSSLPFSSVSLFLSFSFSLSHTHTPLLSYTLNLSLSLSYTFLSFLSLSLSLSLCH